VTTPEPEHPAAPVCAATSCTHPQTAGSLLCQVDTGRLGDYLADIGTLYELLEAAPSMQGREVGTIGGTTLTSQRSVGSMHVMALRSRHRGTGRIGYDDADAWGLDDTPSVYDTLASYAEQVREGRELTPPRVDVTHVRTARPAGPVCDPAAAPCGHHTCEVWTFRGRVFAPLTVASERRLLAEKNNFRWLLLQDWAGEFYDEIRGLWVLLRRATGHGAPKARGVRCREAVAGEVCGGPITLADGTARCGTCGTTTSGPELLRVAAAGAAA
jgi:hypothetical protein